jgi:hypothetical protein
MKSLAAVAFILLCCGAAITPLIVSTGASSVKAGDFPGWPSEFEGRTLTPLALTAIEERFQRRFPGRVGRFTDGRRELIFRWVAEGTRKLHPSADCFKANGYQLSAHAASGSWSTFVATRNGQALMVRERIHDAAGAQWPDVSAWYWSVQLGRTDGPWWAITVAESAALPPTP